jgi:hypothetical protein
MAAASSRAAAAGHLLTSVRLLGGRPNLVELREAAGKSGGGLGAFAGARVSRGARVLAVGPRQWLPLSAETAWRAARPELRSAAVEFARESPLLAGATAQARAMTVGSAVFVAHLLGELDKGRASAAWAHLAAMPREAEAPLFWSGPELAELQASPVLGEVEEQRALVAALFDDVVRPSLAAAASPGNWAFCWALLLSRGMGSVRGGLPLCIPPVLDMFNHFAAPLRGEGEAPRGEGEAPVGLCDHGYDEQTGEYVVTARDEVPPGAELLISYGDLGNAALLRKYGFCAESNRFEALRIGSPGSGSGTLLCSYDGEGRARVQAEDAAREPDRARARQALDHALGVYATSLKQDQALLPLAKARARSAMLLRMSEKRLLGDCLHALDNR